MRSLGRAQSACWNTCAKPQRCGGAALHYYYKARVKLLCGIPMMCCHWPRSTVCCHCQTLRIQRELSRITIHSWQLKHYSRKHHALPPKNMKHEESRNVGAPQILICAAVPVPHQINEERGKLAHFPSLCTVLLLVCTQ